MSVEFEKDMEERTERDSGPLDRPERAERIDDRHPRDKGAGREPGRDMRSIVKDAIKKHNVDSAAEKPKKDRPSRSDDEPADKIKTEDRGADKAASLKSSTNPATPKDGETAPDAAPQERQPIAAPAALSKEAKAIWDSLPDIAKAEFVRREADTQKGVEQLKAKYRPIEEVFGPHRQELQRLGKTEADAVKQMMDWHQNLSNPATQRQAFLALAQSHRFDLSQLVAPQGSQVAPSQGQPNDPTAMLSSYLQPIQQTVQQLQGEFERQRQQAVQSDIMNFSKDKPHFERVRTAMGHLMATGLATGETPKEIFDDAYARACRADPEIFALVQQEEVSRREAEAKAAAEAEAKAEVEVRVKEEKATLLFFFFKLSGPALILLL